MTQRLKRGMFVRVRREPGDDWMVGMVVLASDPNKKPQSVMVLGDGIVRAGDGLMMGGLPLTIDYDAETIVGLMGDQYEMEVQPEDA